MAETPVYDIPYPTNSDPVNVAADIQNIAERIEVILPTIGLPYFTYEVNNNSGVTINKGDPVYVTGFASKSTVAKCDSDDLTTFPILGLAQAEITNSSDGVIVISGVFTSIDTSSYAAGDVLYVQNGGGLTNVLPVSGSGAVGIVAYANAAGKIIVGAVKGNGTWGALMAGLS
jgi:hypothetical protein